MHPAVSALLLERLRHYHPTGDPVVAEHRRAIEKELRAIPDPELSRGALDRFHILHVCASIMRSDPGNYQKAVDKARRELVAFLVASRRGRPQPGDATERESTAPNAVANRFAGGILPATYSPQTLEPPGVALPDVQVEPSRAPSTETGRAPHADTNDRGFTLLEVMLAACVMAFVLTTAITTMQRTFVLVSSAHNLTAASLVVQNELEKLRLEGWATVSAYPNRTVLTVDPRFTQNKRIRNRFTLTRDVGKVRGNNDLLQLTFTITWTSYGRTLSRTFITYYARNGIYDSLYA
jgi:prepilin-type N-terminal cleavage/methylation domain-containing protein